jgi:hypothetical protein
MLVIQGAGDQFAGFILLECAPIQAECVALFAASSTENRLKYLEGFREAAFLASTCGRFALEYVLWENPAALAAARATPIFWEHIRIVEHHTTVRHVSFSSSYMTLGAKHITFARGEHLAMAVYRHENSKGWPQTLEGLRAGADFGNNPSFALMAEDGTSVVLISGDQSNSFGATAMPSILGKPDFRDNFVVVESVCAPSAGEQPRAAYSLALSSAQE